MADLQIKTCLYCGKPYDNQLSGMSQKRFDSRRYCSKECGNKHRAGRAYNAQRDNSEIQQLVAVVAKIDTEAPLFRFLSGQHRSVCQAKLDQELECKPN